jgi:hypothetical protein
MAIFDRTLINELGIEMSDQDFALLSEHFDTTLRTRVTQELVAELSPEQAEQLSQMQNVSDDQLLQWLQANVHNFRDIVSDEIDILLGELADNLE